MPEIHGAAEEALSEEALDIYLGLGESGFALAKVLLVLTV
jgi:hypothetical protein